jgi:hypothetical protein
MIFSHQTAPTQFVEANGIRFANRRFGKAASLHVYEARNAKLQGS